MHFFNSFFIEKSQIYLIYSSYYVFMFFVKEILTNALGLGRVGCPKQTVILGLTEKKCHIFCC